jgi:arylamine N-acetyltransferase
MALTSEQVDNYLERIKLPRKQSPDLVYLDELIRAHLATIPYENLSIHYSETHSIKLDVPSLFTKIVGKGHGGYCMELNNLFYALLSALGFDIHARAGRVWKVGILSRQEAEANPAHWTGWSHMVLIVRFQEDSYLVDVGFGANGPVKAMRIPPPSTIGDIVTGVIPEEHQLGVINAPHSPQETLYILRHRHDERSLWNPLFTFDASTPFSGSDYEIMSFHCHCHPHSPFVNNILCTTTGFDGQGTAISRTMLQNNILKERRGGYNTVIEKLDSEEARLAAIERIWGIKFTDVEKKGVEKWGVAITGPEPEKGIPIAGWS